MINNGVYLAAKFERRGELLEYVKQLKEAGLECTSEWINAPLSSAYTSTPQQMHNDAVLDLEHVDKAKYFIELIDEISGRGGMHVEYGYALALKKVCIIVGPVEKRNLFHWLNSSIKFDTWEAALVYLREVVK